ncbi:ABC transporter substrate binding protein [Globicatella sulfidifaciens]|uniref:ABC transporter substrate binding protein n=1 Tax=Globicatella sulfidifaciens TaxID=136093 RepID=UPI002890643B|nr:ABC transporter substrate binding protein [Globicatella sulfidifaciens]MDT2767528.1 ABC transporter substrate binding protein [Globicatella sulfidifaciens]
MRKLYKLFTTLLALTVMMSLSINIHIASAKKEAKVAIIQLVSHPSLDQIVLGIKEGLAEGGYQEGDNLTIEFHNAEGDMNLLGSIADTVIHNQPDLIFAVTTPVAQAVADATTETPIVLAGITDPLAASLVKSLDQPGGNITGVSDAVQFEEQFDLIVQLQPDLKTLGMLYTTSEDNSLAELKKAEVVAEKYNIETTITGIDSTLDMQLVAENLAKQVDAIFVGSDNSIASSIDTLLDVTDKAGIPVFTTIDSFVEKGALSAIAINQKSIGIQSAEMGIDILKGQNPAEMPIQLVTNKQPVYNYETAEKLGITIDEQEESMIAENEVKTTSTTNNHFSIYFNAMSQGILWGIMGIGLYITFRILRFADLTSEVSFTMGASVAVALASSGVHPLVATVIAILGGMVAGYVTGLLMTLFDIPSLLAGIITLTGFYSINLRIMGKPNVSFRGLSTIYDTLSGLFASDILQRTLIGLATVGIVILLLALFFKTDFGQAVIATGDNEIMADALGISTARMKRFALVLANGIIGLSGALIAQDNGYADISMGVGTVVVALSSIVIGEVLLKNLTLPLRLLSIVAGSIVYRLILVYVLQLGFNANDFKLISATVLAIFLALPSISKRFKNLKKGGAQ